VDYKQDLDKIKQMKNKKAIRKFIKEQIKTLTEYKREGNVASLHYKIDVYADPSSGDMSSIMDYVENNEVVNKYGIKVEIGELESGPQEDEQSLYVKFSFDINKTAGQTAIGLLRDVVMKFIEEKIGAVVVEIEPQDFKPDGPSDEEYDQMAQQSSMDDRRQQGMDPGLEEGTNTYQVGNKINSRRARSQYKTIDIMAIDKKTGEQVKLTDETSDLTFLSSKYIFAYIDYPKGLEETARDLGYLNEFDDFENIDFDVKSINMVYTDDGRFYGFNVYDMPGLSGKRVKLSYTEEINKFLQSKGINIEIPRGYDEDILDQIVAALRQQGIEAEHNDYMDVSEAYTSEWDPETAAKNRRIARGTEPEYTTYTKGEKVKYLGNPAIITAIKKYNDKIYYSVRYSDNWGKNFRKASNILSSDGTITPVNESKLQEMASELGYMNEETSEGTGLMVIPRTKQDANKIYAHLDDSNWYAEWDHVEGYFLFPEEEDRYDGLEADIEEFLTSIGANARIEGVFNESKELKEITVSGGQEAARNYPSKEIPGDMFAQNEVEELLPASIASRNQELKARLQSHANWAKQNTYNNTFVHFQVNTVTDGNNTYRVAMSQHYNGNYTDWRNPKFTEIRVKELDDESDMERDLGLYVVDTTALMQDLKNLKTIKRVS